MSIYECADALKQYNQFILIRLDPKPGTHKTIKVPCNQYRYNTDALNPDNWLSHSEAVRLARRTGLEIGFVISHDDPFYCLDLDDCYDLDLNLSETAEYIMGMLPNAAAEISLSGDGIHLWGSTQNKDLGPRRIKVKVDGPTQESVSSCELYTESRVITLGDYRQGDAATDHTGILPDLVSEFFELSEAQRAVKDAEWTGGPREDWAGPTDDDKLIKVMLKARNSAAVMFGDKASLKDLWEGNEEALSKGYPHSDNPFDYSEADLALANHLAFYTGCDCDRIDRLYRRSGIVRDKWIEREDYRNDTILKAISGQEHVFGSKETEKIREAFPDYQPSLTPEATETTELTEADRIKAPRASEKIEGGARMRGGESYVMLSDSLKYFKDCVYMSQTNEYYHPDIGIVAPKAFDSHFGGRSFQMNHDSSKPTRDASEAFRVNALYVPPMADGQTFDPTAPTGALIDFGGVSFLNTYKPATRKTQAGDLSIFHDFMKRLFPNPRDLKIIISYMAAVVQNPGKKFGWAPVLQGVQGNGKSTIADILSYAVGREHTHSASALEIKNQFNGWQARKLLILLEELDQSGQKSSIETLNTMITARRAQIVFKGKDAVMMDMHTNFLATTNHKTGIYKSENDRRWCVFFLPQQEKADLARDGLTRSFYKRLHDWLNGEGEHSDTKGKGLQAIAHFLSTLEIDEEFDPSHECTIAPDTSSTSEVLSASTSAYQERVSICVDSEELGFKGGWISTIAARKQADRHRITLNVKDIGMELRALGYSLCPDIGGGSGKMSRTGKVGEDSGKRPRLYCSEELMNSDAYKHAKSKNKLMNLYEEMQLEGLEA